MALEWPCPLWNGRAVKIARPLLVLLALVLFGGCAGWGDGHTYYRVRVTDPRGTLIADWIAIGWVERIEGGYRFRAVQRLSGAPYPKLIRYPEGRLVEASGPNILVARCAPPAWLEPARVQWVHRERVVDRSKD